MKVNRQRDAYLELLQTLLEAISLQGEPVGMRILDMWELVLAEKRGENVLERLLVDGETEVRTGRAVWAGSVRFRGRGHQMLLSSEMTGKAT